MIIRGEDMINKRAKKAQVALEYAVLIAIAVAAIIAMKIYMTRSVQGRLRESADEIGMQFSPTQASYKRIIDTSNSSSTETFGVVGTGFTSSVVGDPATVTTSTTWTIPTDLSTETMF